MFLKGCGIRCDERGKCRIFASWMVTDAAVGAWLDGKAFDNNEIAEIQDEYDGKIYCDTYGIWY